MLPRRSRLSRAAFPDSRSSYRAASAHFSLIWAPAKAGGAAAVVSKKVARRSVDRHLLKRRMLEVLRPYADPSRSLVAYAKAGSLGLPYAAVRAELEPLLSRATHR